MQEYCHVVSPWSAQTQFKLFGTYPLPWDFLVSGNFQSFSGIPIFATQATTSAQVLPSLGRNLTSGTVLIDLVPPFTMFEDRSNQVDVRLTKTVRVGRTRIQGQVDVYNAFNRSSVLTVNTRYGASWLRPIQILPGRIVKFGAQLTF